MKRIIKARGVRREWLPSRLDEFRNFAKKWESVKKVAILLSHYKIIFGNLPVRFIKEEKLKGSLFEPDTVNALFVASTPKTAVWINRQFTLRGFGVEATNKANVIRDREFTQQVFPWLHTEIKKEYGK